MANLEQRSLEVCQKVFSTSDAVLKNVGHLGFNGLLGPDAPSPNSEVLLSRVKLYDSLLTALIRYFEDSDKPDLAKILLNAKQQILRLEILINAVKANDEPSFNQIVEELARQANI